MKMKGYLVQDEVQLICLATMSCNDLLLQEDRWRFFIFSVSPVPFSFIVDESFLFSSSEWGEIFQLVGVVLWKIVLIWILDFVTFLGFVLLFNSPNDWEMPPGR